MVSTDRLAGMDVAYRAATTNGNGALCGCGRPIKHPGGCAVRTATRVARQAERDAACTTMCGCGKPTTHLGMCAARWQKRREKYGASGNAPAKPFDINQAIVDDRERMMRLAMAWTFGDRAKAEDLVSQAHVQILSKREQFVVGTNFPAWCTTILKNLSTDSHRRAKPLVTLEQKGDDGETFDRVDPALTTEPVQEAGIEARETAREVLALPPHQRTAMLLAGAGQTLAAIAEQTDVSMGTVKSRISRGRHAINGVEARVVPMVSKENRDSLEFVLTKLREERDRIVSAITALEQMRPLFVRSQ